MNSIKMGMFMIIILIIVLSLKVIKGVNGLRFVINKEECLSHKAQYEGDVLHFSFAVIKADSLWHSQNDNALDLLVKGPDGDQVHDAREKTSEKSELVAHKKGLYTFCFYNKSPYHETIDFDIHAGHYGYFEHHAKEKHLSPLYEHIAKLEEELYNIQFEQHWLEAETDRQAIINESLSRRTINKALLESAALIGASILQVYLLKHLFERKIGHNRV